MNLKAGVRGLKQMADEIETARKEAACGSPFEQRPSALGAALNAVAAQVRVVGPRIGVAKGVLIT